MAFIWIVSEDLSAARAVEIPLRRLGGTMSGPPERSAWKEAREPDLVVLVGAQGPVETVGSAEPLLEFLAGVRRFRRPPVPALYVEPPGGHPPADLIEGLIDDRPSGSMRWPPVPEEIARAATEVLHRPLRPATLRERARTEWVRRRVELLYAGLDIPALRQAVDPRNADRPVLLIGEAGTERGLLARYIHQLAEPVRHRFVRISLGATPPGALEREILARVAGTHATLYLHGAERAADTVQEELVELLTESGGVALESLRWIVSVCAATRLPWELNLAPWIRVELPPLRERDDFDDLVSAMARDVARRTGREIEIPPETLGELRRYGWPLNLEELTAVLEASIGQAGARIVRPQDLRFDVGSTTTATAPPEPERPAVPEPMASELPGPATEPPTTVATPVAPSEEELLPEAETAPEPVAPAELGVDDLLPPLVEEIRPTLLALRTYAGLSSQQPDDEGVRRRLRSLLEADVGRIEAALERLERFARFDPPRIEAVQIAALLASLLERRRSEARERALVVLEEFDPEAPPARADEEQLRFALDAVFDRVMRMVPQSGDLYVGHRSLPATADHPARHRLLIRFHSPEDVLAPPHEAGAGGMPLEVVMARALLERMGGRLAVDVSGPHDNLVLIELPS